MSGVGLRSAFNIGKRSLMAQLAGLNVTGNNIANVNTEGYSRQELSLSPGLPLRIPEGTFGTGVEIDGVRRIRDQLVDNQLRTVLKTKSEYEVLERIYNQIETVINEPSESGLRILISQFFDNFHELANDPESTTIRFNLREHAKIMIAAFHQIDQQLRILSGDINAEITNVVERFNSLSREISVLNNQIVSYESTSKGTANDLRDKRDKNLDEMSAIMEVFPFEKPNGTINVAAQSRTIITSNTAVQFTTKTVNDNGNLKTYIVEEDDETIFQVHNGELGALIQARNEIVPHYRDKINTLAQELIDKVNNYHNTGVGLQGTNSTIPKDIDFFRGSDAISIDIAFAINEDVKNIAAAQRVDVVLPNGTIDTRGSPGDNRVALDIANLKQKLILNSGTESLIDFFNSIVSEVGNGAAEAANNVKNQNLLIEQFKNLRDSTSGVSLDEEFVNLIKYQRGFQASARIITTTSDMFETLINM